MGNNRSIGRQDSNYLLNEKGMNECNQNTTSFVV